MSNYGLTDIGKRRPQNQDSFAIASDDDVTMAIVCDGIGGHQAGDVASKTTCNVFVSYFRSHYDSNPEQWFRQALKKANNEVYTLARSSASLKGMGTTVVAAIKNRDYAYVLNVGDSRCYILTEDNKFTQITEDHSLINELMKKEGISYEQAKAMGSHVITRAVGVWENVEGDIFPVRTKFRYMVLCSDGLHNYVSEENIVEVLNSELSIAQKCQKLVDMANEAGGYDNITMVIIEG